MQKDSDVRNFLNFIFIKKEYKYSHLKIVSSANFFLLFPRNQLLTISDMFQELFQYSTLRDTKETHSSFFAKSFVVFVIQF